ncbi:PREDICTED: NEDD4-binding protein 2-like [Diuraphis noxia]|uniref:NEDD4-binding protein 2-like n=1 Tax=Diuraphis noxia TaxID=143948 RepID=UPI000763A723|nr:PREDICTED: NEDD4-binding protein 2-like [Diuraphis noxia]
MTNYSIKNMSWSCLNTKEDLLNLFTGHVDHDVIEMVIESRNNDLLLAYRDLIEITKIPDPEPNLHLLSNDEKNQSAAASTSNIPKINWERLSKTETPINKILYLVSKRFKVLVLMRGCQGSGKSYLATNILNLCYKNVNINDFIFLDETLARKLQEESTEECSSSSSNPYIGEFTFSAVLTKKLLLEKFKHINSTHVLNVLRAKNYKYHEANEFLSEASGIKHSLNQDTPTIQENEGSCVNRVGHNASNNDQDYIREAQELSIKRQQLLQKANQSLSAKQHPSVTAHYLERADIVKQNEKHAKTKALVDMVKQNENATSLDLHNLTVSDAILALDIYLDNHISNLKKYYGGNRGRQLTIITGRGKHSPKGIARIKPVVVRRLLDRRLMYLEPEVPGTVMVIIKKNSLLSSEF